MRAFAVAVAIMILTGLFRPGTPLHAQDSDQTISFSTPSVELVFKPPFRSGFNSAYLSR